MLLRLIVVIRPKIKPKEIPIKDMYRPWKIKIATKVLSGIPIVFMIAISFSLVFTLITVVDKILNAATPTMRKSSNPIINFSSWTAWKRVPWVFSQVEDA